MAVGELEIFGGFRLQAAGSRPRRSRPKRRVPLVVGGQLMLDGAPYTGGAKAISDGSGSLYERPPVSRITSLESGR